MNAYDKENRRTVLIISLFVVVATLITGFSVNGLVLPATADLTTDSGEGLARFVYVLGGAGGIFFTLCCPGPIYSLIGFVAYVFVFRKSKRTW